MKDQLALLDGMFLSFDMQPYVSGTPLDKLRCLQAAAEFAQVTEKVETRFMGLVKRLKAAYDISSGSGAFSEEEKDKVHFYLAVRSI